MSAFINRVAQVYCDGPHPQGGTEATDGSDVTIRGARATAKQLGWITRRIGGRLRDFCPACATSQQPNREGENRG